MAIDMIGESFGSKCWIWRSSMFGGSARRTRCTLACTSCCAMPMSTPRLNVTRTFDRPCDELELISLMP
jgi:hypothetical protein